MKMISAYQLSMMTACLARWVNSLDGKLEFTDEVLDHFRAALETEITLDFDEDTNLVTIVFVDLGITVSEVFVPDDEGGGDTKPDVSSNDENDLTEKDIA